MNEENSLKTLTHQTKCVRCVIDFPKRKDGTYDLKRYNLSKFYDDLSSEMMLFAFALHDKDINDQGEVKTPHVHLLLSANKRHQLKFYIYLVADLLQTDETLVSVRVCDNEAGYLQYMTHKNNKEKYQYDFSIIKSNYSKENLEDMYNQDICDKLTAKDLIELCKKHNKLELMEILTPMRYNAYLRVINEIYRELAIYKHYKH